MTDVKVVPMPEPAAKGAFCPTPTARDMLDLFDYCRDAKEMGLVLGASGVGKTTTIKHYVDQQENAWMVTISQSSGDLFPCLAAVSKAIVAFNPNTGSRPLRESIIERLYDFDDGLLIFDEAQHLTDRALEELRSLYDETGVPIVLCGGRELAGRWMNKSAERRGRWAQLLSRIGATLPIERPSAEDVDALCDHRGRVTAAARTLLKKHSGGHGGLRRVESLIVKGLRSADGAPVEPRHIEPALRFLGAGR